MIGRRQRPRMAAGDRVAARTVESLTGPVEIPDRRYMLHLQFRRFAGCPVCNLHLRSFVRRHDAISSAAVREVVVFHSPAGELRRHTAGLPFTVVADPGKRLYAEFGVESSPRALLDPRAWGPILLAVAHGIWALVTEGRPLPALRPHGGRLGLPADLLIAPDGQVLSCKYGRHVDDHWSVDELLALARPGPAPGPRRRGLVVEQ